MAINKMNVLIYIHIFILSGLHWQNTRAEYKLIYQKDVSEHCRRRVISSIFLGRQVVEANARLMQFSRLELPYSCFISVRTESGSNMVMMIQVAADELQLACSKNMEQLLVYEMGETFGGYWGPLPESVMRWEPQQPKVYTLKTTHPPPRTTENIPSDEESEEEKPPIKGTSTNSHDKSADYVDVEVPLLNVSVNMMPGHMDPNKKSEIMDVDELFDIQHNVTPVPGVSYDTSILPLVQFRILQKLGNRRQGDDEPPRYDLDIVEQFTPDMRLTFPTLNPTSNKRKPYQKQKYPVNRRLIFKKHKTLLDSRRYFDTQQISQTITRRINYATKYTFPTSKTVASIAKFKHTEDSWQVVEDLMKKLNKTQENENSPKTTLSKIDHILLENISNINHNKSVYLSPNLSEIISKNSKKLIKATTSYAKQSSLQQSSPYFAKTKEIITIKPMTESRAKITRSNFKDESISSFVDRTTTENIKLITNSNANSIPDKIYVRLGLDNISMSDISMKNYTVYENFTSGSETDTTTIYTEPTTTLHSNNEELNSGHSRNESVIAHEERVTGSMVGHESWENVVQAAPEMAVLLNQTVPYYNDNGSTTSDNKHVSSMEFNEKVHNNEPLKRKKKDIHSISIENARPYKLTTKKERVTTTKASLALADMQEFAQLVELQDDELHGRVALRYLRQYVGPSLFNLCALSESTTRHVHLFNSSRIVLAVSNFTLERMIVILTSARTLLGGESRCPTSQLECQVSGARVCLDSMVACDGVPNCGSYDIYDEDRLLCGELANLKHNVYLAAFTFLAVLMTALYGVHYWLKRCVPKVADAFFVFTDGAENVLFLDSIMRSPNDTDDMSRIVYQSHMFDDDNIDDYAIQRIPHENICKRFMRKLCFCFGNNKKKIDELEMYGSLRLSRSLSKRMYSFTELEIRKMTPTSTDIAVQTGESLEMNSEFVKSKIIKPPKDKTDRRQSRPLEFPIMIQDSSLTLDEPLPEEHKDELSLLKFINDARTNYVSKQEKQKCTKGTEIDLSHEKELTTHSYEHHDIEQPGPSRRRRPTTHVKSAVSNKHLRFEDMATTIPPGEFDYDDDDTGNVNADHRRSAGLGESRLPWHARHLDPIEETDEHSGGTKEHRHFWGLPQSKSKKTKKKSHVSTLRH